MLKIELTDLNVPQSMIKFNGYQHFIILVKLLDELKIVEFTSFGRNVNKIKYLADTYKVK